jgi:hypothetical protein
MVESAIEIVMISAIEYEKEKKPSLSFIRAGMMCTVSPVPIL